MTKLLSLLFLPIFTLLLIWALGWGWFATSIALTKPYEQITTEYIEAIVVLTGGSGRINEGLDLREKRKIKKMLISGVNKDVTEKDILKDRNNLNSDQLCCITLGYKSVDTISNATEVAEWVNENDINSFFLVTSSYHMPRAQMEVRNVLPNKNIVEYPVFSKALKSSDGHFWKLTFSEYNKTLLRWMQNLGRNK